MAETKTIEQTTTKTSSSSTSLLSQEEYAKLSPEEKKKYIEYNPSASDRAMAALIKQANIQLEALEKLDPFFEKIKFMPNPLPGEQLNKLVEKIEKMETLLDPIEKLASNKYVGVLVKPLVNLINSIFGVIGQILVLMVGIMKGTEFLTDAIIETNKNVDWDGLKKTMDDATNFKKETTASVETAEINWDKIPNKQIKDKCKEAADAVEACWNSLQICDSAARIYKKISETTLVPFSWKAMVEKLNKVCKLLGVDFNLLDRPNEKDMEKFEKIFPDPKKIGKKMSGKLNKLVQTKQYISIENNEKLKKVQAAKTEYKTISDRLEELNKKYDDYLHGNGKGLTASEYEERNNLKIREKQLLTIINS